MLLELSIFSHGAEAGDKPNTAYALSVLLDTLNQTFLIRKKAQ